MPVRRIQILAKSRNNHVKKHPPTHPDTCFYLMRQNVFHLYTKTKPKVVILNLCSSVKGMEVAMFFFNGQQGASSLVSKKLRTI